jgi:hypothetical protein
LTVDAGGRVAGLKLLANGDTGSNFIARADEFGVDMPNGTRVLTVNSSGLVIDGSGTFSGTLSAGDVTIENNDIEVLGDVAGINYRHGTNGTLNGSINGSDSGTINIGGRTGVVIRAGLDIGNFGQETVNLYGDLSVSNSISVGGSTTLSGSVQMTQYPAINSQNGYKKLTGGTIIQWGRVLQSASTITVTFPIQFPNACLSITATKGSTTTVASQNNACTVNQFTTSNFKIDSNDVASNHYVWWMAIGY